MPMNVILLERVPKLGQMGDVVKVKPGFARNFLLPQKKALRATKGGTLVAETGRAALEAAEAARRASEQAAALFEAKPAAEGENAEAAPAEEAKAEEEK